MKTLSIAQQIWNADDSNDIPINHKYLSEIAITPPTKEDGEYVYTFKDNSQLRRKSNQYFLLVEKQNQSTQEN